VCCAVIVTKRFPIKKKFIKYIIFLDEIVEEEAFFVKNVPLKKKSRFGVHGILLF